MFLACQVYPEDSVGLYNAYLDDTKEAYGYLLLDLTQNTNDFVPTYSRTKDIPSSSIHA